MLVAARKRGRSASRRRSSMARRFARNPAYISRSRSRVRGRRSSVRTTGAHSFSRHCASTAPIETNGVYKAGAIVTSFSQLVQSTDFSSLFDQYRIRKVVVTFQLITNPDAVYYTNLNNTSSGNATNWYPKLWYIPDYDGGVDETIASIKERQGVRCRIMRPNSTIRISYTPKCRVLTYSTSTSTGYAPKNIKVDMTDTNVEHYGLKYVVDTNQIDPIDAVPFKFIIEQKLYFTCYGVR